MSTLLTLATGLLAFTAILAAGPGQDLKVRDGAFYGWLCALVPAAPAVEQTINRDLQREPLNPTAPVRATDTNIHNDLPDAVAPATAPATKTIDSVVLVPDNRPRAAELALKAVLKAAEAAKVA